MKLELTKSGILQLIARKTVERKFMEIRIEEDPKTGEWCVTRSGWQPLNELRAAHPSTLLRAIAKILELHSITPIDSPKSLESDSEPRD